MIYLKKTRPMGTGLVYLTLGTVLVAHLQHSCRFGIQLWLLYNHLLPGPPTSVIDGSGCFRNFDRAATFLGRAFEDQVEFVRRNQHPRSKIRMRRERHHALIYYLGVASIFELSPTKDTWMLLRPSGATHHGYTSEKAAEDDMQNILHADVSFV